MEEDSGRQRNSFFTEFLCGGVPKDHLCIVRAFTAYRLDVQVLTHTHTETPVEHSSFDDASPKVRKNKRMNTQDPKQRETEIYKEQNVAKKFQGTL